MPGHVVLATGTIVSATAGAPTVEDMAISLTRLPRFAANGILWFTVGLHTFVVCDLLPGRLKVYGIVHDGAEVVGNDVPKPMKTCITERREKRIDERMLIELGLPLLSVEDEAIVKAADIAALHAEIFTAGPLHLRPEYAHVKRVPENEALVLDYIRKYPAAVCCEYGGPVAMEFIARYYEYRELLAQLGNPASTVSAQSTPADT